MGGTVSDGAGEGRNRGFGGSPLTRRGIWLELGSDCVTVAVLAAGSSLSSLGLTGGRAASELGLPAFPLRLCAFSSAANMNYRRAFGSRIGILTARDGTSSAALAVKLQKENSQS